MRRGGRLPFILCLCLAAWLSSVVAVPAHDMGGGTTLSRLVAAMDPEMFPPDQAVRDRAAQNPGPCTEPAAASMPDGDPHDHQMIANHRGLGCGLEQSEFLPLKDEVTRIFGREDVVLGEMDVKADIAAVAVTFPRAGILFFDVADAAKPKFLSSYRGGECDSQPIDINCGAFVDLSADGKIAFLAVQNLSSIPDPSPTTGRPGTAGVELISLANPRAPQLVQTYTVTAGFTGTHTSRSHVIPGPPESGANGVRAPGEYIFSNQNSVGVNIARVIRTGPVPQVVPVPIPPGAATNIEAADLHDTFIQNDPVDNRTYLYLADGFGTDSPGRSGGGTAFVVYDVTDPAQPRYLAQWDLTPECETDWYSHTIDVATRNGRRYVTMPAELFVSGNQSSADTTAGCGKRRGSNPPPQGNGNVVGPMWIVDATDFKALPQRADSDAEIKRKSQEALVTTWENPAGRAGGNLTFSPHNQQIVEDKIYLSQYHGGAYVLDASKAFDGRKESPEVERPRELAFVVPAGEPTRKNVTLATNPLIPFITAFPFGHPEIWDMFFYKGSFLVADETGGLYAYAERPGAPPPDPILPGTVVPPDAPPGGNPPPQAQPPQAQPPARRSTASGRRFLISRRAKKLTRGGIARVEVACRQASPCRGTIRLRTIQRIRRGRRTTRVELGRRSFTVPARSRRVLRLRLSAANRRLIVRQRRTRVSVVANVAPEPGAGSARRTVVASFRLSRPRGAR